MSPGALIAFEGCDGAGKDTVLRLVERGLVERGYPVFCTAQPSKGPIGLLIREALAGRIGIVPEAMGALFAADRADHVARVIRPALWAGSVVLTSRYELTNVVYRCAEIDFPLFACRSMVGALCDYTTDDMPEGYPSHSPWGCWTCAACGRQTVRAVPALKERAAWARNLLSPPAVAPKLTLVMDIPTKVGEHRRAARGGGVELYDDTTMQRRVRSLYRMAAALVPDTIVTIDASPAADVVAAAVLDAVLEALQPAST